MNVFDGFEQSKTIRYMKGQMDGVSTPFPLKDTFRTGMILVWYYLNIIQIQLNIVLQIQGYAKISLNTKLKSEA